MYYAEIEKNRMLGGGATWKPIETLAQWKRIKKRARENNKEAYLWNEEKNRILDYTD